MKPKSARSQVSMQDKLEGKAPFSQYSSLSGANIIWGSPTDTSAYPSDSFDIVYDNNGKDLETCKVAIDHFKVSTCPFLGIGVSPDGAKYVAYPCAP